MTETSPSRTALGVAWLRAAHQALDPPPLVLEDRPALALFGADAVERLHADSGRLRSGRMRALRAHVVLRSRFAEDRLEVAAAGGVHQYVLLGAGYDTFAVRQPEWARGLHIVEVDQAAIQRDKRARLERAGLVAPSNVTYLEMDFERETLVDGLARAGVSRSVPTFFSWLGVTMYLTEPAIDAVLETVVAHAPGTGIVLTFAPPEDRSDDHGRDREPTLADKAAALGEPWLSYFTPDQLASKLSAVGFSHVDFLTPDEARAAYWGSREDGLPLPRRTTIVHASR